MAYEKSWWTPEDKEIGKTWRNIFNLYLRDQVTWNTANRILKDQVDENYKPTWYTLSLEGGYLLHTYHGNELYSLISKLVPESDRPHLKSFFENKKYEDYYECNWTDINNRYLYGARTYKKIYEIFKNERLLEIIEELKSHYSDGRLKGYHFDSYILDLMIRYYWIICDLYLFRSAALKTWGEPNQMHPWSKAEFGVINSHFKDCVYELDAPESAKGIDPETIKFSRLGFQPALGENDASLVFRCIMTEFSWDFVDELLDYNKFKSTKGSAVCNECGQMFPKSFYGRQQIYCSIQCKRRAAKRRQREREKKKGLII